MLIEFKLQNYRSFLEEQTLSMIAANIDELVGNCHNVTGPSGEFELLKAASIQGQNASGKSNLIKAIEFVKEFVLNVSFVDWP